MTVLDATFNGTVSFPRRLRPIALVTGPGPNTITPIDTTTGTAGHAVRLQPTEPGDIAISPDGATAYVVGVNSDAVTPVDTWPPTTVGYARSPSATTPPRPRHHPERVDRLRGRHRRRHGHPDQYRHPARRGPRSTWAINPDAIAITPDGPPPMWSPPNRRHGHPDRHRPPTRPAPRSTSGTDPTPSPSPPTAPPPTWPTPDDDVTPIDHRHQHRRDRRSPWAASPTPSPSPPTATTAYVANGGDNTVTPIDLSDNTAGDPDHRWESDPDAIAVTPDGTTAEVVNEGDNDVTPIDTATNTAGPPIRAGNDPWDIAITPDQAPVAALSVTPANAGPGHRLQRLGLGGPVVAHHQLRLELR